MANGAKWLGQKRMRFEEDDLESVVMLGQLAEDETRVEVARDYDKSAIVVLFREDDTGAL